MRNKNDSHPTKFDISRSFGHIIKRLRHRKTIAIGFIALLLIILTQLCINNIREARSTHYLKIAGSCNQITNIKIYDETGGIDPTDVKTYEQFGEYTYQNKAVNTIENENFKNYVTTISKYVFEIGRAHV